MRLKNKIKSKKAILGVIGLGYVGLPLAIDKCKSGFTVYGLDSNQSRLDQLMRGVSYVPDVRSKLINKYVNLAQLRPVSHYKFMELCDVITICVPTPLTPDKKPNTSYILAVCHQLEELNLSGKLIILESTTYPGTTREIVLKSLPHCHIAYSPERVNPGSQHPTWDIPRVVGGMTTEAAQLAADLFSHLSKKVVVVDTPEIAEMSKLFENTFRNLNINFCNEMLVICREKGIDPWQMFKAAYTKPYSVMEHWPGLMGGHCIPVDPYYLKWYAEQGKHWLTSSPMPILDKALRTQEVFAEYVVRRFIGIADPNKGVTILGRSYKPDVPDDRESPAYELQNLFHKHFWSCNITDPLTDETLNLKSQVILLTAHSHIDYKKLLKNADLIFDLRGVLTWQSPKIHRL